MLAELAAVGGDDAMKLQEFEIAGQFNRCFIVFLIYRLLVAHHFHYYLSISPVQFVS